MIEAMIEAMHDGSNDGSNAGIDERFMNIKVTAKRIHYFSIQYNIKISV
jgi:hypothetical protein